MTAGLHARNISVIAGGRPILNGVDLVAHPGKVTAIVGPNGAGKSTLLKVLSGDLKPQSGNVVMNGKPLSDWSMEDRALQRAVLPQTPELAFSFRTRDVVELGRHPHRGRATPEQDRHAIAGAMHATETTDFASRDCKTLSGGEMHRTHYARVLAQIWSPLSEDRARVLLLDEPTASLDLFHQHAILSKAREVAEEGAAVVAVLHDLNLAATYADELIVLAHGTVDASGTPREVLTPARITRIWRVHCRVNCDTDGHLQINTTRRAS